MILKVEDALKSLRRTDPDCEGSMSGSNRDIFPFASFRNCEVIDF